ncbi:hypothetical protein RDABS01_032071 [Bienertia sinuspersici]
MGDEQELTKKNEPISEGGVESKSVPTDYCQNDDGDDDIEPLSGKPFFAIDIAKSHVGHLHKYQLVYIPFGVCSDTSKHDDTSDPHSWQKVFGRRLILVKSSIYYKKLDNRWKAFAEDNKLKVGDVCVFELMESSDTNLKFKVRVLRGDFPSALVGKQDGTIGNPIVVD